MKNKEDKIKVLIEKNKQKFFIIFVLSTFNTLFLLLVIWAIWKVDLFLAIGIPVALIILFSVFGWLYATRVSRFKRVLLSEYEEIEEKDFSYFIERTTKKSLLIKKDLLKLKLIEEDLE
ncbi:hypothetical protein [Mycoplasma procyoni]|uniref:hypothetical protein n=1 Tax=Mycoplasma procyoni TaxID=568784 RepID=UPI00197C7F75|nr:hypothetical protein [Mycoplasma procyoni]MBN3534937.1 hypothetical protein [Mycoplasma procyoni]